MKKNFIKTKPHVAVLLFLFFFVVSFSFSYFRNKNEISISASEQVGLKVFREEDIRPFDGTNDSMPIYLAMNGLVYDVSSGRDFYRIDGPYHYLAGKDSSTDLNMVGGEIIKRKYPVIGKLVK